MNKFNIFINLMSDVLKHKDINTPDKNRIYYSSTLDGYFRISSY